MWHLPDPVDSAGLHAAIGGHPLVAEILTRRGYGEPDAARAFLDPDHYRPLPAVELPDIETAAARLLEAIEHREGILVWGDFDVDGQTSTALLVDALRGLGADVRFHIPHRLTHGHGVQPDVLAAFLDAGDVGVVLTCDTGVAAFEAAALAAERGVAFLITDHHSLPSALPDAPAIVNPQRLPLGHPLRDLPGVGVTYKLVQRLYELAGRAGDEERLLDLVALGIVADVAAQRADTRYLLQRGIERLRYPTRVGLQALMAAAQVDPANLSADTIGYQIGPRLNALGRLDDARQAVQLLTTDDRRQASQIANNLEVLNRDRRAIEGQITAAALAQLGADPSLLNYDALVLAGKNWHPGVIGIVASRLVEAYGLPAVLLAIEGDVARGSARSVPGVDIGAAIAATADILLSHGGHPGAAGCTLLADFVPKFRRRLSNEVARYKLPGAADAGPVVDAVLGLSEITMPLAEELNRLAPFGAGNPPVHIMTPRLRVVTHTTVGLRREHRRLTVEDAAGERAVLMWWRGAEHPVPPGLFDLLVIPRINDYKGRHSLQLEWADSRPTPGVAIEAALQNEVHDLRRELDPLPALPESYVVWAEGVRPGETPFDEARTVNRWQHQPADALVVWTVPPGRDEIEQMIGATGATRFYVIGRHIPAGADFLRQMAGMAEYAVNHLGGEATLPRLAAALAERERAVRIGLEWLAAKGRYTLEWLPDDGFRLEPGGRPDPDALPALEERLSLALNETAAFRTLFGRADVTAMFGSEPLADPR